MTDTKTYMDWEIAFQTKVNKAAALLPAWFIPRMMSDHWEFGLLLVTGQLLHVEHIDDVSGWPGNIWIDVTMANAKKTEINGSDWVDVVLAVELAST
jgi:hypothetical protein